VEDVNVRDANRRYAAAAEVIMSDELTNEREVAVA
jgi:hypothetical protein